MLSEEKRDALGIQELIFSFFSQENMSFEIEVIFCVSIVLLLAWMTVSVWMWLRKFESKELETTKQSKRMITEGNRVVLDPIKS